MVCGVEFSTHPKGTDNNKILIDMMPGARGVLGRTDILAAHSNSHCTRPPHGRHHDNTPFLRVCVRVVVFVCCAVLRHWLRTFQSTVDVSVSCLTT